MEERTCPLCHKFASAQYTRKDFVITFSCKRCGTFDIEPSLEVPGSEDGLNDLSHILSALTRTASDAGGPMTLTSENASDLITSAIIPTLIEQMDKALIYLGERQQRPDKFVAPDFEGDYPIAYARDGEEFRYLFNTLYNRGLLDAETHPIYKHPEGQYRLTPEGWQALDQLRRSQPDSNQAFVAMWFDPQMTHAWKEGVELALNEMGYNPLRIDEKQFNDKIDDQIIAEIRRSGLLIADVTGHRQGVYFEAGFAMGLGIPVIWTCKDIDIDKAHFDTRQYNHIVWESPEDLREKLLYRIAATIPGRII